MNKTYYEEMIERIDKIESGENHTSRVCYVDRGNNVTDIDIYALSFEGVNEDGYEVYRKQNGEKVTIKKVVSDYSESTGRCYSTDVYPVATPVR